MTDTLPRAIADLVGVVFGEPKRKPLPKPDDGRTRNPIHIISNPDGSMTLMRFRKTVGWIEPVHLAGDRDGYAAKSVHGTIKNCYSLRHAQAFLLSSYH